MKFNITDQVHDLEEIPPAIGQGFDLCGIKLFQLEIIELTDRLLCELFRCMYMLRSFVHSRWSNG
jgi:hypothetical protein